ncbi:MAG: hypothetical protein QGH51_10190, partial [Planctomycetota bacterium]|nr:hypothetical protein [Planctomycetota bacterium]
MVLAPLGCGCARPTPNSLSASAHGWFLSSGTNCKQAQAEVVGAARRGVAGPMRRTQVDSRIAPATAPQHAVRATC